MTLSLTEDSDERQAGGRNPEEGVLKEGRRTRNTEEGITKCYIPALISGPTRGHMPHEITAILGHRSSHLGRL